MKPEALFHYRDYIKSPYWTERKRLYFETHPHVCAVCGHPDVDLHHLKYGEYGREEDKNLAPLCRVHHQALHVSMKLRKNTFYQSRSFIEDERERYLNARIAVTKHSKQKRFSLVLFIDRLARPIWKVYTFLLSRFSRGT